MSLYIHRILRPSMYLLDDDEEEHDMFNAVDARRFIAFAEKVGAEDMRSPLSPVFSDGGIGRLRDNLCQYQLGYERTDFLIPSPE